MSAVDFRELRWRVPLARVLELLVWVPTRRSGDELWRVGQRAGPVCGGPRAEAVRGSAGVV